MVFVVAIIILALLGVIGLAANDTALLNILMAANGNDAKNAFFLADSGANAGHEYLERAIASDNSSFYDDGTPATNASAWENKSSFDPDDFPIKWDSHGSEGTYVRAGLIETGLVSGSAIQGGTGYGSAGRGASSGGTFSSYLIRSHRQGAHNSVAEVDLGWRHINQ
ncbi:pilus assembly PilX family protein [Desulfomicrobium salsuginis]